jgi:hypothetical protein
MAAMGSRVNLRLDDDVFEAYNKVAVFFRRSVADLMREALGAGVPTMQALGLMIDQAVAGDVEAMQRVMGAMLDMHQGSLDLAREFLAADVTTVDDKSGLAACSDSNTAR